MNDHPIQGLMQTAMENIRDMVDVNTIVGDPVEAPDGTLVLPISKVGFGFAAGGSEFTTEDSMEHASVVPGGVSSNGRQHPFGGGSGGGVSITPIAFLVVGAQGIKVMPLNETTHLYERMFDLVPQAVDKIQQMFKGDNNSNSNPNLNSREQTTATTTTTTSSPNPNF